MLKYDHSYILVNVDFICNTSKLNITNIHVCIFLEKTISKNCFRRKRFDSFSGSSVSPFFVSGAKFCFLGVSSFSEIP